MVLRAQPIDPLNYAVPIVDPQGRPTPLFLRQWIAARNVNLSVEDVTLSIDELRELIETAQTTLAAIQSFLDEVSVTPGVYGSGTHVAQITVDEHGRITNIAEVAIT